MTKGRLEAFSDGVLAIIITIMVLELKAPHEASLEALRPLRSAFLSYLLSFVFIGIYWNNHHHLFQTVRHVNGRILWANMHLLLWLSLIPFVTNWLGDTHFKEAVPAAAYGVVMLMSGCAYFILTRVLVIHHGRESLLATAVGRDRKGIISVLLYVAAIALAFIHPLISCGLFVIVAIMWLIPDRRIESVLAQHKAETAH